MPEDKKNSDLENDNKQSDVDEAKLRFICFGLYGFGCGTDPKRICEWRKEKNWEERRLSFHEHDGD